MRDIKDLTAETTSYELFTHVYWQVVTRHLRSFSDLVNYLECVEEGARKDYVLQSAFPLIREIYWGFFRDLNPKSYPVLWGQLALPNSDYPFGGELKLSMSITDIYCAFIDIHGYTEFSKNRNDATLLRLLDDCIEEDVKALCRENNVIGNRARGDEIILIGISAYDVVNSVVLIADYFGERKLTGKREFVKRRRGEFNKLPDLSVSAGIAGGRKYTSLVITKAGDLSGTVVNTAARLQSRANRFSSAATRILTTQNVRLKYESDTAKRYAPMFTPSQMAFLDVGYFSFKGLDMRITEILVDKAVMHRLEYKESLVRFLDAVENNRWTESVFLELADLMIEVCKAMPKFELSSPENKDVSERGESGNTVVIRRLNEAAERFSAGRDFSEALDALSDALRILEDVPGTDSFLLMYGEGVEAAYRKVCCAYDNHIEGYTEKNRKVLFLSDENAEFDRLCRAVRFHETMKSDLVGRVDAEKRRRLWNKLIKQMEPTLEDSLYLGK